jgi:hypothetical protein
MIIDKYVAKYASKSLLCNFMVNIKGAKWGLNFNLLFFNKDKVPF